VEIRITHLSGSRAGQDATYDSDTVTLGRSASNLITFDPEKDILVSGRHAKLIQTVDGWSVEDLGSTNGTWVDGERISSVTPLQPGSEIELGKGGSRFRVEWGAATVVTPLAGPSQGAPPPAEGRTVMMSLGAMQGGDSGSAPPAAGMIPPTARVAAAVPPPPKKKRSPLFLFLIVILVVVIGGIAMIALMPGESGEQEVATTPTDTGTAEPEQAVVEESAEIRQELASQTAELERLKAMADSDGSGGGSEADLERQLREQQEMIAELTRQLQSKNDEVASARRAAKAAESRPAPTPKPAPAPAPKAQPETKAATPTPEPKPVAAEPAPPPIPEMKLVNTKFLKRRISVKGLPPEIPLPGVPDGGSDDMAQLVVTALRTTGKYASTEGGSTTGSVTLMIAGFHNEEKSRMNTQRTTEVLGGLSALAGGTSVPTVGAGAQTVSANADGTLRVRVYDASNRQVDDFRVSANAAATKTSVSAASLSFGGLFQTDTPAGDVTRQLVAQAVDKLMKDVDRLEWVANITAQTQDKVLIDCGRACQIEEGDVFDVLDGGKAIARVKVISVDESSATASVFAGGAANTLTGKAVHYAGREKPSKLYGPTPKVRQLIVRRTTGGFDAPGNSFKKVKTFRSRTRLTYLYSVGYWAKASDGRNEYWVQVKDIDVSN